MKRNVIVPAIFLLFSLISGAGIPVGTMTPSSLGIEYTGLIAGQTITEADVPSVFNAQYLTLRYSPIDYLLISFGIGGARFTTAEYESTRFIGKTGISISGGVDLYSPRLLDLLKFTGGIEGYLLNSSRDDYRYTGGLANPFLGIVVLLGSVVDIQAGLKGQFVYGTMADPSGNDGQIFGNATYPRGYVSITMHSVSGAYASLGIDASRKIRSEWSDGPQEASLSLQIGFIIRDLQPGNRRTADAKADPFSAIDKMKEKQDKMAEEMKK